jgi:hypothetical protein
MYDVKQFRRLLYLVLFMGISGFSLAAGQPGAWLLVAAAMGLNAWLVFTGRFLPLPRAAINFITLAGVLVTAGMLNAGESAIIVVGDFVMLLHLVKLFEQRGDRDYAQLLVLSLLLMVAAAISTASLLFGLLLVGYLILSLYCCLLFHLKVESQRARDDFSFPVEKLTPAAMRLDQRGMSRSMRQVTALIWTTSIACAVLVFLFLPRAGGQGWLGPGAFRQTRSVVGFTDEIRFQDVARISQRDDVIAHVKVTQDGQVHQDSSPLLLRGLALDVYSTDQETAAGGYSWHATPQEMVDKLQAGPDGPVLIPGKNPANATCSQDVTLQPTGTHSLFVVGDPVEITNAARPLAMRYTPQSQVLSLGPDVSMDIPVSYSVRSSLTLQRTDPNPIVSTIDPRVTAFAMRPEVSGVDSGGTSLAQLHLAGDKSNDPQIARAIETYLRNNFKYTLDLTDAGSLAGRDPVVAFLYDFKKGHCEYFASAMTLMCQSLKIPARVVVGYRSEEFNSFTGYYVVRQSHAHAWVEVLLPAGWVTFDPTSTELAGPTGGIFSSISRLVDYLNFTWATSVVAYDRNSRQNLIDTVNNRLSPAGSGTPRFLNLQWWSDRARLWFMSSTIQAVLIVGGAFAAVLAAIWVTMDAWRLRRRAARVGIDGLPTDEKYRLVRQLAFYDDLLVLLEKRGITRPRHLTPMEFSGDLSFLPSDIYAAARGLTRIFYRIRYGNAELDPGQSRRVTAVVERLDRSLTALHWPSRTRL